MVRSICAVVISVITWFVVAAIVNRLVRALFPGYASVEATMAFTLSMQLIRLALALMSSLCAGAACAAVAKPGSHAPKVVAAIMVALFIPVHYSIWDKFPVWYHLFFLLTLAPTVVLGASLVQRRSIAQPATL